jgi:hypothetical protein
MAEQQEEDQRVSIFIEDHTGNKRREVRIAANVPVRDLIPPLISALNQAVDL